ncbi:major capsid protein [Microviridae sp.]|nr:major capsid protein [Microviridae sp.]
MRNQFNLSHEHKTSVDMGQLIPVMTEEVLPGDTFIHRATALARVAPLVNPLMHRVELRMHTFYCPNRLIWQDIERDLDLGEKTGGNWEDFITGNDESLLGKPTYLTGAQEPLLDYMGIPPKEGLEVDAFPLAMYNMVYNEFYRDQDLQTKRGLFSNTVARCAWQKDYFTIARPQPQQGEQEAIPIQSKMLRGASEGGTEGTYRDQDNQDYTMQNTPRFVYVDGSFQDGIGTIEIDDLRRQIALQRFAEARMRFGSRYIDYLRYLGVNPTDGRLDRPEYLGGGKELLSFSEVLSTAKGTDTNVGDMFGHGIGMGQMNGYRKQFEEHGWVMTFLSARPKTVYQDAVPRKFQRHEPMDYWQKELEVLPWQEVKEQEVHKDGDPTKPWGYVPRYEEYRHGVSYVSGSLRGGTENDWHMAREFATPPALNGSFVECTPTDRIYQDSNMPDLVLNIQHNIKARRLVGQTAAMGVDL